MNQRTISVLSILFILIFLGACTPRTTSPKKAETAFLATQDAYYTTLGIQPDNPQPWEDGMRTDGQEGSYEWWYTDAEFDDGTTIVVVFYSKDHFNVKGPARPTATIDVTLPDGTSFLREVYEEGKVIDAATGIADVKIQDSYLRYVDGNYELKFVHKDITYEALMTSKQPMWRPETGHLYFGNAQKNFFAWFVAQPSAEIHATLSLKGKTRKLHGHGYHDHNWGNIPMNKIMNHWYWGRVSIGGYDIITADIIAEQNYGYTQLPIMLIAKEGTTIKHDLKTIQLKRANTIEHPTTKKFMDNHLTYIQTDENGVTYKLEYFRKRDIEEASLLNRLPWFQRTAARIMGANPTYVRVLGDVKLTVTDGDSIEVFESEGLWDQMFFGNNKEAIINAR